MICFHGFKLCLDLWYHNMIEERPDTEARNSHVVQLSRLAVPSECTIRTG